MDAALRAGIAVFDADHYHAAHDAWEDEWLDMESGSDDERLLHGLIQYSAAVHHATRRNWAGAGGLSESAREYLDGLPADYRGVNVAGVREFVAELECDPERVERERPLDLTYEGETLALDGLDPHAGVAAAVALAGDLGYDEDVFEHAARYARDGLADGDLNEFAVLLCDFASETDQRPVVGHRLEQHVQRRRQREQDVAGLFD